MKIHSLERLVRTCLSNFYSRRTAALDRLNLPHVLSRKNPYLFRATGIPNASEMIEQLLAAHVSSSDEAIFGEEFFEPLCKAVSKSVIAAAKGIDFVIETDDAYQAISLKSGPNAFNSSQVSKQNQQFDEMKQSLNATLRRLRKEYIPIMGCGYGRVDSPPTAARKYYKLAGQSFWGKITGDPNFYLLLVRLMRDDPDKHRVIFRQAWNRAQNRFVKQFTAEFCDDDGNILWEKLVEFNSGRRPRTRLKPVQFAPDQE